MKENQGKKQTGKKTTNVRKNSGPTKAGRKSGPSFKKNGVHITHIDMKVPWSEQASTEDLERLRKYNEQELQEKAMWASLDEADKTVYRKMFSD